jgi:hypothetical protein
MPYLRLMKVYAEFSKNRIRCQIEEDVIDVKISSDFFKKIKGTESYQMFFEKTINKKIKDFIFFCRNKLSFYQKLQYILFRNIVTVSLDEHVQKLMTIELIQAYATLAFDARDVFILKGSERISDLRTLESLKGRMIHTGKNNEKAFISDLS